MYPAQPNGWRQEQRMMMAAMIMNTEKRILLKTVVLPTNLYLTSSQEMSFEKHSPQVKKSLTIFSV